MVVGVVYFISAAFFSCYLYIFVQALLKEISPYGRYDVQRASHFEGAPKDLYLVQSSCD